jgi:DNA polymerase-3 subunit epsilon
MVNVMGFLERLRGKAGGEEKKVPIAEAAYIIADTELTGLNERKDSLVSIGAVKMTGGRLDLGATFYRLINPEKKLTAESVVIHNITPSEVMQKPAVDTVLAEFVEFCGDAIIVGHCVSIDLGFINREMKRIFGHPLQNGAVDTFALYGWLRDRMPSHKLFATPLKDFRLYEMARCFGVPVQGAHNALMDAFITAQLFQRFLPLLAGTGIRDVMGLLKAGYPFKGGDSYRVVGESHNF